MLFTSDLLYTCYIISVFQIVALFFFFSSPFFVYILINLKQRPVKITGKNIKSYATAQVHFPWEREGSLTAKSPNLSFKIYYPILNFTSKLFSNWVLRAKFQRITQNSHYSINLLYIMFQAPSPAENPAEFQRITQIPRNSPTQSANYAKFAHFVNIFYFYFRHLP